MNMRERIARAIEAGDVNSSIRLTRLVDGESEYTATISGETKLFDCRDDAQDWVYDKRNEIKVDAILKEMIEPTEGMLDDAHECTVTGCCLVVREAAGEVWEEMIQSAIEGK